MFFAALPVNVSLTPILVVGASVAAGVFGTMLLGGTGIYAVQKFRAYSAAKNAAKKPAPAAATVPNGAESAAGVFAGLTHLTHMFQLFGGAELAPVLKDVVHSLAHSAIEFDKAQKHKTFNAFVAHVLPQAAPLLPVIDKSVDVLEERALGTSPSVPSTPAPTIAVPAGHPVLELLQRVLEASVHKQQTASKTPSPAGKAV